MVSAALLFDTAWSCLTLGAFGLMTGLLLHEAQMSFRRRAWQRGPALARVGLSRPTARNAEHAPAEREAAAAPAQLRPATSVANTYF
jgi:hypothetical protein